MAVLFETRAAAFRPGVLGPPHCPVQLGLPRDIPACLSPLAHPGPQPWSHVSVRKGLGAPQIWVVGRERGCTLGPLIGELVLQPLPPL